MKRKILCILLVCCLLLFAGCREPVPPLVSTTATEPSITAVEPTAGTTETTTAATEPEETQATEAATTPTEPQATEPTKAPTQPTDPTEPSKPEQTIPKPTEPTPTETVPPEPPTEETVPPTTEPEQTQHTETESERIVIDTAAIEASARSYAQTLGFVIDTSLGKSNSGYYNPEYRPLFSTQDGDSTAVGITNATKNQLNSRFSTEYCDVLVPDAFGYVRYNCLVEYSHTDELGDWYYIYAFYG